MKVALLFREKRPGGHSIEAIFNSIQRELQNNVEFEIFYVDISKSRLSNIKSASRIRADVYHITGDCNYLALGLPSNKTILTVHDIGHYKNTLKGYKRFIYGLFWWRIPLLKAAKITTVSVFTKQCIQNSFSVGENKINVVYNPVFSVFTKKPKILNFENPRILQIGSGHNKNFNRLVEAVKDIPCVLVLVRNLTERQIGLLNKYKIVYEQYNNVDSTQVNNIYNSCDILFFASTYEGFGLPIIEAQYMGIPVITSNLASMPEIGQEGALYVDPFNVNAIKKSIRQLQSSPELVKLLIEQGYKNIARFKLYDIAQQYLRLYKEVYANAN